ncbi:MAG: hypothetical protein KBC73_22615 [Burkholderiaceae bacterium]|nr:hypothetical protein [Burkholderiaceae bacterium]
MTTQQQIDACEQELASLLSRVLESTIDPIKRRLESLGQEQVDLKKQIETLGGASQDVSRDLRATENALKRLKSEVDEAQQATITQMSDLMADNRTRLLVAQAKVQTDACAILGERLAGHTTERTEWLAQSLGSAVSEGALQQQRKTEELRIDLGHRVTTLKSGGDAVDQKVAVLTQRLQQLHEAVLRLQQDGQAMQHTTTRGQREVTALCEALAKKSAASVDQALRPIRHLLTAALVMAFGGALLAAYGQWGLLLR